MRPFDLGAGPLLRARLLRLGDAEHVLLVTMHHIVSDGWSLGVLVREVGALYDGVPCRAGRRRCRSCACSTRTTRRGSASWLQGEVLERAGRLLEAAAGRSAARCWSCPRTVRVRRCRAYRGATVPAAAGRGR